MRSIVEQVGDSGFVRVRLGLGRPVSARVELADWVLADFDPEERPGAEQMADRAADAVEGVIVLGIGEAMNRFNVPANG